MTLNTVQPNDREFHSCDTVGTLDKQYVLIDYHTFVKSGQHIIVFSLRVSLQDWIQKHKLVIKHRLKLDLITILRYFCNKYFIYFLMFFCFIYFYLVMISYPVTCLKLFNTWYHQRS